MKHFKIKADPYNCKVLCLFGSAKEAKKILKKELSKRRYKNWDFKDCDGLTGMYNGLVIMWIRKLPKKPYWKNILSHELCHCIDMIGERVGLERGSSSSEGYAYLTGFNWIYH